MNAAPYIACAHPPAAPFERWAFASSIDLLAEAAKREPYRVTAKMGRRCAVSWKKADRTTTLGVQETPTHRIHTIADPSLPDVGIRLSVERPPLRDMPNDRARRVRWAMDSADEALRVLRSALAWADLDKDGRAPVDVSAVVMEVGPIIRSTERHSSPLSLLRLASPWAPTDVGEWHDFTPLAEDDSALKRLSSLIPPYVAIEVKGQGTLREGLDIEIRRVAQGIYGQGMNPVEILRAISSWSAPR